MFAGIKKKILSRDGRVIFENFLSMSSLQIITMLLPIITLPYVLHTIGLSKYGIIALATSLVNFFTAFTDYSFKLTATRDVAVYKNSLKKLNIIYSRVTVIKCLLCFISLSICFLVVCLYPPFYKEKMVFFLYAPMLVGYAIFPEWFFQGIEKMKYITFLNISVKIFFTVFVFIFIKSEEDYWIYPLLQSLGFIFSGIIAQFIMIKIYKISFQFLKRRSYWLSLKVNFPIFINQFLPNLYNNAGTLILGFFASNYLIGVYDGIRKIIDLAIMSISIISRVFFPFLNRNKGSFRSYKKLMLITGVVFSVFPIILSKWILMYLNIDYPDAFAVLSILAMGIFGFALYDIFGVNYFVVNRRDKIVMNNTIFASLAGFALAMPLIYFGTIIGAAINLSLSRYFMGLGLLIRYQKEK